jgi:SAM-dependent methyltransferase
MPDGPDDREDQFSATTYGRSFADVYDRWYPADDATTAAVARISELAGPGGSVLELGVGTGRLAVPLAERGHTVWGVDASDEMLARLATNAAHLSPGSVVPLLGDLADPSAWPTTRVQVVVAAFNLVCNLTDPVAQAGLFASAAAVLAPGGHLVVETFLPAPVEHRERHLEVREVRADAVVLIASDTDPVAGVVTGQHIELRDGEPVRLRPWQLRLTTPGELDRWAADAGLDRVAVRSDWSADEPAAGHDDVAARIAVYRAPVSPA